MFKVQIGSIEREFATPFGVEDYLASLEFGLRCVARIFSPEGKEIYL
jgi:hypothetical protein